MMFPTTATVWAPLLQQQEEEEEEERNLPTRTASWMNTFPGNTISPPPAAAAGIKTWGDDKGEVFRFLCRKMDGV